MSPSGAGPRLGGEGDEPASRGDERGVGRGSKRGRPGADARKRKGVKLPRKVARDLSQPVDHLAWSVTPEGHGERIDLFLLERLPWRSRTSIVDLLADGQVRRNGEPVTKKSTKLRAGDRIEVAVPPPDEAVRHDQLALELDPLFLHDDPEVAALNKPPGLVVHPVGRIRANTLIQALHWTYRRGPRRVPGREPPIPRICHRLDRDTSGVIVLAKTPRARAALQAAFEGHKTEKDYLAVVAGRVPDDRGTIELPLGPDEDAEIDLMMTVRDDGVYARTDYEVLERFASATLVRFRLHTGRQHQIRVHARAIGHPVLLDSLYGDGQRTWPAASDAPLIERQALHAQRLVLPHPTTGERLELIAPLPDDMRRLIEGLRLEL